MSLARRDPFFDIAGRADETGATGGAEGGAAADAAALAPRNDGEGKVMTAYCVSRRTYRAARAHLAIEGGRGGGRRRSMSDVIVSLLRRWVEDPSLPGPTDMDAPSARDRVRMSVAVPCDLHAELGVCLAGMPEYTSASAVVRGLLDAWADGRVAT